MRLVLSALALCSLVSLGCGLELTKEEGEQRRAAGGGGGGMAGMTSGDLTSSPASPSQAPASESQPSAEAAATSEPPAPAAEPAAPPPNTTAAADAVTVGTPSEDPNLE